MSEFKRVFIYFLTERRKTESFEVCIALSFSLYSVCHNYNGISNWYEPKYTHTARADTSLFRFFIFCVCGCGTVSMLSFLFFANEFSITRKQTSFLHPKRISRTSYVPRNGFCSLPTFPTHLLPHSFFALSFLRFNLRSFHVPLSHFFPVQMTHFLTRFSLQLMLLLPATIHPIFLWEWFVCGFNFIKFIHLNSLALFLFVPFLGEVVVLLLLLILVSHCRCVYVISLSL